MKATLDASPIPNHSTIKGRNASGGIGRSISRAGSTRCSRTRERPTAMPASTPSAAATRNPWTTRARLAATCSISSPEAASFTPASRTTSGSGSNTGLKTFTTWAFSRLTSHQPAKKSATDATRSATTADGDGPPRRLGRAGDAEAVTSGRAAARISGGYSAIRVSEPATEARPAPSAGAAERSPLGLPRHELGVDLGQQLGGQDVLGGDGVRHALDADGP